MAQKIKVFSIWDKKACAYANPFYYSQIGQAIRGFEDAINDAQSPFYKHPEDFSLFHIGEWDDTTGTIQSLQQPVLIEEAVTLTKKS